MWSETSARIIKENFVPVAVSGHVAMSRKDAEGEFIRTTCGLKLAGAGGNIEMLTATGKRLGNIYPAGQPEHTLKSLQKALTIWKSLPANERQPGAVKIGEAGPLDANVETLTPPAGGLILKVSYRTLTREKDRSLRHAVAKDFPNPQVQIPWVNHYGETFEAQPDYMWLTEREWKALIPAKPKTGDSFPVSPSVQDRLFRFHLVPTMALGENASGWNPKSIRAGKLRLFVEETNGAKIQMRLEGYALLGSPFAQTPGEEAPLQGYEPRLLGFLTYHQGTKVFTRFEVVALGDAYGKLGGSNAMYYRPGRHPLGVAFSLVSGASPADRVPPRAAVVYHTINPNYLGKSK